MASGYATWRTTSTPEMFSATVSEIEEAEASQTFCGLREVRGGQVINNGCGEPIAERLVTLVYARDVVFAPH
jgi:hypothetical protein